jgi:cellulose synthase/poly-beta-1,6-N-acetylglucosamine synthase-like glycosyltransferase
VAELQYPRNQVHIIIVADRCNDGTAVVARKHGIEYIERFSGPPGKGAAIAWAIDVLEKDMAHFDAIVILDADTVVDPCLLQAFNKCLIAGYQVQQAYNDVSNPWETPFTRLIAVTSLLRNRFFYKGKSRIGLSGMLMGTGICLSRQIVERHRWTAFSVGEDWEFSVSLLAAGEKIYFNPMARVFARESRGFQQASSQRLRWASGRYAVAASSAWQLLTTGLRHGRLYLLDAALTLLAPNYSTQATLALFSLVTSWFLSGYPGWRFLITWAALVTTSLSTYFLLGVALTKSPLRTFSGIALIPVFLPWRMAIEVLGLFGYGRKHWHRTPRLSTPRQRPPM